MILSSFAVVISNISLAKYEPKRLNISIYTLITPSSTRYDSNIKPMLYAIIHRHCITIWHMGFFSKHLLAGVLLGFIPFNIEKAASHILTNKKHKNAKVAPYNAAEITENVTCSSVVIIIEIACQIGFLPF